MLHWEPWPFIHPDATQTTTKPTRGLKPQTQTTLLNFSLGQVKKLNRSCTVGGWIWTWVDRILSPLVMHASIGIRIVQFGVRDLDSVVNYLLFILIIDLIVVCSHKDICLCHLISSFCLPRRHNIRSWVLIPHTSMPTNNEQIPLPQSPSDHL